MPCKKGDASYSILSRPCPITTMVTWEPTTPLLYSV